MAQGAPFQFRITLPGQPAWTVMLQRFAVDIDDWRQFWQEYFAPLWFRHVDTQYVTGGGATGDRWPALSERYAQWKDRHWPGLPIGVLSGATRESLTSADDRYSIWEASGRSLTVGSSVPWAIYQQRGTKRMPARPPLKVSRDFLLEVGRLLNTYAHDVLKAAGA